MSSPNFEKDRLWPQLRQLDDRARALFAAACASRVANCTVENEENAPLEEIRSLIQEWWRIFNTGSSLDELEARSLRIAEEAEERGSMIVADAAAAAHFACVHTIAEAGAAADRVLDTIDSHLNENETEFMELELIWNHPLTQTELAREQRDLELLKSEGNWQRVWETAQTERALGYPHPDPLPKGEGED